MNATLLICGIATACFGVGLCADEFGKDGGGLRCYTGDSLAEMRTSVANGPLKRLAADAKAVIVNASTLAILLDYRKHQSEKEQSKLVVGVVKEYNSKVSEFKTYTSKDPEFELLIRDFLPKRD
jgi:hypothetical protein